MIYTLIVLAYWGLTYFWLTHGLNMSRREKLFAAAFSGVSATLTIGAFWAVEALSSGVKAC